ncbi:MAG: DUF255 domain-containing protein [Gammaproteobacteria bacterium]
MKIAGLFAIGIMFTGITFAVLTMDTAKTQEMPEDKDTMAGKNESPRHTNRLAGSFSPYLRQHAHNPVDWYPWGEEALEKARRENKPIFLSIGYSTCYWCHVMERMVFSDEEAGRAMNEHFVNIKVDRESRPDIDVVYMLATQMMTGRGGWPNNLLLTPDMEPFFASGTLMKDQMMSLINNATIHWKTQRNQIDLRASQMGVMLQNYFSSVPPLQINLSPQRLADEYFLSLRMTHDSRYGGFGTGTKFAQESLLLFLLDYAGMNGNSKAMDMVRNTVDHMLVGGVHDHVGGGFHRYATDRRWNVPHFEKMLYNQGQMATVLSQLYEKTGEARYKRALERLLAYVGRVMVSENGVFYSALDAETDEVEGIYYVWNREELKQVLGLDDYNFYLSIYDTSALQNFPGHKYPDGEVLHRKADIQKIMKKTSLSEEALFNRLDGVHEKLRRTRTKRKRPLRDEKSVVAWNGMMIEGYANAGRILDNPAYIATAEKAVRFILDNMRGRNGKLSRIYMDGARYQNAFLDDYAWLAKGLMALYRATGNKIYKDETVALLRTADRFFLDTRGGGYYFTDGSERLPVRVKQGDNTGSLPPANAVIAHVFADLYAATGAQQWKDKADSIVGAFAQGLTERPDSYGHLIYAMLRVNSKPERKWLAPVTVKEDAVKNLPVREESKDKLSVHADIVREQSTPIRKIIKVILDIDDGWHLNTNPASLDFLIPTVADIQTEQSSVLDITYPEAEKLKTPLGRIDVYAGKVEITATVKADEPIDVSKMRLLLQVQACKDSICYPPSQIALPLRELP